MGSDVWLYGDAATAIFTPLLPYIIVSLIYPPKEQLSFHKEIFKPAGEGDKNELEKAIAYLKTYRNLVISSSAIAVFIGFVGIMSNLENISSVGKNFGLLSLTIFYAAIFITAVIEPLKGAAKKSLIS